MWMGFEAFDVVKLDLLSSPNRTLCEQSCFPKYVVSQVLIADLVHWANHFVLTIRTWMYQQLSKGV